MLPIGNWLIAPNLHYIISRIVIRALLECYFAPGNSENIQLLYPFNTGCFKKKKKKKSDPKNFSDIFRGVSKTQD